MDGTKKSTRKLLLFFLYCEGVQMAGKFMNELGKGQGTERFKEKC